MLAWIRGGEGEMTAERRATHTHAGAVGAVFVYSIRTCAEFNCACVLLRAQPFKVRLCELHTYQPALLAKSDTVVKKE